MNMKIQLTMINTIYFKIFNDSHIQQIMAYKDFSDEAYTLLDLEQVD